MSAISLKSITGITSITTPAGVDNQLTLHTNDTTQRVKVTQSGIEVVGVATFQDIDVDGHTELDNVNISGVSTYAGQARFNGELVGSIISVSNSININDKLIHSGDTDTAIRFPANDTFTVEVSGNERFRITDAASTFQNKLIIDDGSNGHLFLNNTSSENTIHSGTTGFAAYKNLVINAAQHTFKISNTEKVRILSSGELRIISSGNNNDPAHLRLHSADVSISTNDAIGVIRFAGRDAGGAAVSRTGALIQATAAGTWDTLQTSGYSATHLDFFTQNQSGTDTIAAGARLRIDSSGRLLLGTTTEGRDEADDLTIATSGSTGITLRSASGYAGNILFSDGTSGDDEQRGIIQYHHNGDSMRFFTNATERFRIDSDGRVLIGGGSSPSQVGDARLLVYSDSRLHPAIKADCIDGGVNRANGYTMISDNYAGDESQVNLGVSYSSSGLVLSRGVKVSNTTDDVYLSSQDSYATRPCAIKLDDIGAFNFLTTETNATVATDSAVTLTEVFKIDRVGNVYQKISGRNMYFGASQQLRIGVQSNGDSNIEAVSGDLKIMDGGSVITQVRSDGLENFQHVYPAADNSKDLGKSTKRWANIYTTDLHLSNEGKSNVVDGTWGDWTLQEGENKIFMINNRTGKKYSLKMEEEE